MSSILGRYIDFVVRRPKLVLILMLFVTVAFSIQLADLKIDSTPYFIDRFHPERLEESVVRDQFTSSKEQAFVLIVGKNKDVFDLETLSAVDELTRQFENITFIEETDALDITKFRVDDRSSEYVNKILDGGISTNDLLSINQLIDYLRGLEYSEEIDFLYLESLAVRVKPIHKVRSITNIENISSEDDTLLVDKLIPSLSLSPEELNKIREQASNNLMYEGILLSADLKATNIQIEFNVPDYDSPNLVRSYAEVVSILEALDSDVNAYLSGTPVVNSQIVQVLEQDNATFFPLVIIVIGLVLILSYKRAQALFCPLLIAILSVVWAMGWMAMIGIKQNIVTTALPVFLITIGVADAIHYLNGFYQRVQSSSKSDAAKETLASLFKPLFLTTLTTMFGFFALSLTDLIFVRQFGQVMVAGVFFAFILTVTILPALLQFSSTKNIAKNQGKTTFFMKGALLLTHKLDGFLAANRKISVLVISAICIGVVYLNMQITFDQHNTASFDPDSRLRVDDKVVNTYIGGTSPLNISFHASEAGAFQRVDVIEALDKISNYIKETHETVGYVTSPVDFIKRVHQVIGEDSDGFSLPKNMSSEMIAQYYLLYETSNGQEIRNVVDETYTNARIALLGHTDQASVWSEMISDTDRYISTVLPKGIEYKFSSVGKIQTINLNEVIASQSTSLVVAIALVLTVMIVVFRSIVLGVIGVIPLVLTLGVIFALMVVLGIDLDIGTCLIAGLVFGIGVDYSIHFLVALKRNCLEEGMGLDDAIKATLDTVSQPIWINSLSLSLGFLVLGLSSFQPLAMLGIFVSGTMVLCAFLVLIIMPQLLRLLSPKALQVPDNSIRNVATTA